MQRSPNIVQIDDEWLFESPTSLDSQDEVDLETELDKAKPEGQLFQDVKAPTTGDSISDI